MIAVINIQGRNMNDSMLVMLHGSLFLNLAAIFDQIGADLPTSSRSRRDVSLSSTRGQTQTSVTNWFYRRDFAFASQWNT